MKLSTVLVLLLIALGGCSSKQKPDEKSSPAGAAAVPAQAGSNPMEIHADANLMQRVQVGTVGFATLAGQVTVAARVEVDETGLTRVGAPVMGRLTSLTAHEGDRVQKGEVLGELSSPGLSDAQLDFLKALSKAQVAERAVERAKVLLNADVIGRVELQRREAELTDATAEVAAGRDRLLQLGMSQEAVDILRRTRVMNSTARVVASMAGTVMHRRAAVGQVVQSADTIYEIADLSRLWLVADVPEYQGSTLRPGQTVEAKIEALGNRVIRGQLSFVNAIVNPETRTVLARMNLRNPDGTLKPSMLASMTIQDRAQKHLAVPSEAVVRDETGEYVFLEKGSGTFLLHPVKLGPEMDGKRVIEGGVKEGTRIVTGGSFHLNNERRRRNVRGGEGG